MWRLIIISVLLTSTIITIAIVTFQHYKKPLFTSSYFLELSRDITISRTHNPYTVVIGSHLITISSHSQYLDIKSSDWTFKNCEIILDPKDKITGSIEAAVLGEKILVWDFDEINYDDFEKDVKNTNYTLLMIDLWLCNYKALAHFEGIVPKIVVNKKSVIVFCPSEGENCIPSRFNEEGKKLELKRQVVPESWNEAFLEGFNQDQNYVYAYNDDRGVATIKVLDHDFNVMKQTNVNFSIEKLAVSPHPTKSQIGVLYEEPKHQFHIAVFDSNLQLIFTNKLPEPDEYQPFMSYLTMDSRGNSFVTSVLVNKTEKYHLVRNDANGHLVDQLDIDEYWRNEPSLTQTFLIEDSEYCLVNHHKVFNGDLFVNTYIKCINIT